MQTPEGKADHRHLARDGKAVGATSKQAHPVHQLSCSEGSTGRLLWHCNGQEKHNEISELKPFLTPTTVKGRLLRLDALHTQRAFYAQVKRLEGDSVLLAKDKQPTLKEDIADFFLRSYPRPATLAGERRPGRKDRGDWNTERLVWSPDWNDCFATAWQGIEQVFRLQRTVRILTSGEIHHEVVYGISRLSFHQAPAPRILALGRDQWAMENRLHWRRDVRLGEDACQTRTGSPPSLLAQLNSAVLSLMDRMGVRNVPRQMRYVDAEYNQALDLVLTGQCSVYENGKALIALEHLLPIR